MNISEGSRPTLHDCDLAAKDAEIARLNKIVSDCLAAMPFGNIATHTPENLPVRIADLAGELARSECLADELVEALKRVRVLVGVTFGDTLGGIRLKNRTATLETIDLALKKVGAE